MDDIEQVRSDYDAVPYDSHAFPQSAPGHLAAIAFLFGLTPPEVATARVLEIGCSVGGNLIPFAATHPAAKVVGIDLSQVQIDEGRARVKALGLDNLELVQGDIAELDLLALGQFDFVICHGVYSWVPDHVQEAILAAFEKLLAPEGLAYLSYNAYPGWKAKEIVRDAMMLRGAGRGTPAEQLNYARGMIDFLQEVAPADSVLARALSDYSAIASKSGDYYLIHEQLERFNSPCYFLELLDRAGDYNLGYLAEATPVSMFAGNYGQKVAEPLIRECGHSQVVLEQYLDFVVNRPFRQTLLVHADRTTQISYQLDRNRLTRLHYSAWAPAVDGVTRLDGSRQEFGQPGGFSVFTDEPGAKAVLDALTACWPWTMSWDELIEAARSRLDEAGIDTADVPKVVAELAEVFVVGGLAQYRLDPIAPGPESSTLQLDESVRRMAELSRGDANAFTFNQWHETLILTPLDSYLLPLLNGTRDGSALVEAVLALAHDGTVELERNGQRVIKQSDLRARAAELIAELPQRLARMKFMRPSTASAPVDA